MTDRRRRSKVPPMPTSISKAAKPALRASQAA